MTRMIRRTLIAIGAAAGLSLLAAAPAAATFPGANGLIAFQGARGNQYSTHVFINTIRPDGTGIRPLAQGYGPSWSPDGRHLVFWRGVGLPQRQAIFTMRADGSGVRRVGYSQFSEAGASYSPNGHRILFGRGTARQNQFAIATMRLDGGDERVVARGDQFYPFGYSPSGGRILYSADCQMWDMRPNGSHRRQLTNSGCPNQQGDYSPDGKHISFWHDDRPYVMRSDGSHAHPLGCGPGAGFAVYSPDGRKLAWEQHIGPPRSAVGDIFTGTVRCTNPFQVTYQANLGGAFDPSWQPLP
jgi:Tol biopolymer transport system component